MSANNLDSFLKRLIYFGGNLGIKKPITEYTDIEKFIVDATHFMETDSRTTQSFFNWLHLFAPYISPSKLRRILKEKEDYNSKWLGQFVYILNNHPLNSQNWSILKPFCKKATKYRFSPNSQKYLKATNFILKNCPELKFRVDGNNQVLADLKAYLNKNKKFQSLYQVAKDTFNPKNRINYEYRLISYL